MRLLSAPIEAAHNIADSPNGLMSVKRARKIHRSGPSLLGFRPTILHAIQLGASAAVPLQNTKFRRTGLDRAPHDVDPGLCKIINILITSVVKSSRKKWDAGFRLFQ